jgi:hypothetical protein
MGFSSSITLKFVHPFVHPSPHRPRSVARSWARALFPPLLQLLTVPFAAFEVANLDRCCELVVEKSI